MFIGELFNNYVANTVSKYLTYDQKLTDSQHIQKIKKKTMKLVKVNS